MRLLIHRDGKSEISQKHSFMQFHKFVSHLFLLYMKKDSYEMQTDTTSKDELIGANTRF